MNANLSGGEPEVAPLLPEGVPVTMPELPVCLSITTLKQFKACSDPTRSRILGVIQNQPQTAKQLADRLGIAPGTIGHHLQMLEEAGLAQVVARRLVRGIVAKYYTRTARIFEFELPRDVLGGGSMNLDFLAQARTELAESLAAGEGDPEFCGGLPHARLSAERAQHYNARIQALMDDLVREPLDPEGTVVGLCAVLYVAPPYLQVSSGAETAPAVASEDGSDASGPASR